MLAFAFLSLPLLRKTDVKIRKQTEKRETKRKQETVFYVFLRVSLANIGKFKLLFNALILSAFTFICFLVFSNVFRRTKIYQKIAFDEDGKTARVLEFDIKRPIQQDGKMTTMSQSVKAPFIGLVPIPSLLIDRVDVDFQMEVTDTSNVKSTTNAEVETKASAKHWFINAEISGKVTTARENTRMTNQTAKYQIHVSASQQPQTEGLSKLMDIMASCIEPINTESSK